VADKPFRATQPLDPLVAKQVPMRTQQQVDAEFLVLIDQGIEQDKKLLKKLAKV
jgi:hypothetical protein